MRNASLFETLNSEFAEQFNPANLEPIPDKDPSWSGPMPSEVALTPEQRANGLKHCAELRDFLSDKGINSPQKSRLNRRLEMLRGLHHE